MARLTCNSRKKTALKAISVQTLRGNLYDRNGIVLAQNAASYNIAITPALLPEDEGTREQIYRELSYIQVQ